MAFRSTNGILLTRAEPPLYNLISYSTAVDESTYFAIIAVCVVGRSIEHVKTGPGSVRRPMTIRNI